MEKYTLPFSKIGKKDVNIAGGKGANLGEMSKAGFPIPGGFVLLAGAFERYLEETGIGMEIDAGLNKLNYRDTNSVGRFSRHIRGLINTYKISEFVKKELLREFRKIRARFVAVRSSATAEDSSIASWAGELETYLFVSARKLPETVKLCWSSLFTPRAIFYRFEQKLHKSKIGVAVVIQRMVNSEISGICFTAHPVTKDRSRMVIEAGYGLGEAIVSGLVTPDTYIFDKNRKRILDIRISQQRKKIIFKRSGGTKTVVVKKAEQKKQVMSNDKIIELAEICRKVEKHYRLPQDIEWAWKKGKFYILQSRPITTL